MHSKTYSVKTFEYSNFSNNFNNTSVHDEKHKRQSSVCKWLSENEDSYGIIHKFVKYNDFNLFIASKFGNK